jgi:hypothetical protein
VPASRHEKLQFKVVETTKVSSGKRLAKIRDDPHSLQNLTEFSATSMLFGSVSTTLQSSTGHKSFSTKIEISLFYFGPTTIPISENARADSRALLNAQRMQTMSYFKRR